MIAATVCQRHWNPWAHWRFINQIIIIINMRHWDLHHIYWQWYTVSVLTLWAFPRLVTLPVLNSAHTGSPDILRIIVQWAAHSNGNWYLRLGNGTPRRCLTRKWLKFKLLSVSSNKFSRTKFTILHQSSWHDAVMLQSIGSKRHHWR